MPAYKRVRRTVSSKAAAPVAVKMVKADGLTASEVKKIVRKELSDEIEEKQAITQYNNVGINTAIPSGVVINGGGNFFKLMPQVFQSTTGGAGNAYNERVGNEINLKELDIHGFLSYSQAITGSITNSKLAVRVMILRCREINDQELLFDNMPTGQLLRFGQGTTGVGGPVSFVGTPLDSFRDINTDLFAVNYDKVHYLNAPIVDIGTTSVTYSQGFPSGLKMLRHKIKFGQKGLRLKYSRSSDTEANNFPYFMVIGVSSMGDSASPSDDLVRATFNITSTYTDA